MARVIEYAVKSDLSGKEIPKGQRVIVRIEFEDKDTPNYVADLTTVEGKSMVEHCHARTVTPRNRKPAEEAA